MKIFLKAVCAYILLGLICLLYTVFTGNINYLESAMKGPDILVTIADFFIKTIPFIITIMFCAIRVQKRGERFFVRLIPFYLITGIIFSALITFIDLKNASDSFYEFALAAYTFIQFTNYILLPICVLENLNPNNMFAKVFKVASYISIGASVASIIVLYIKIFMVSKLPNVYGYDGFNFSTIADTEGTVMMIVIVSIIVGLTSIVLGFISNTAFETDILESDSLSYDELLKQADQVAEQKRKQIYGQQEPEVVIDRSVSETTGMMNINNQLNQNSNVGQVKSVGLGASLVEGALPSSSGPVMNSSVPTVTTNDPVAETLKPTTAPEISPQPVATPSVPQVEAKPVNPALVAQPATPPTVPVQAKEPATQPAPQPAPVQKTTTPPATITSAPAAPAAKPEAKAVTTVSKPTNSSAEIETLD